MRVAVVVTVPVRPPPKGKPVCTVPVRLEGSALAVGVPNENPEEIVQDVISRINRYFIEATDSFIKSRNGSNAITSF